MVYKASTKASMTSRPYGRGYQSPFRDNSGKSEKNSGTTSSTSSSANPLRHFQGVEQFKGIVGYRPAYTYFNNKKDIVAWLRFYGIEEYHIYEAKEVYSSLALEHIGFHKLLPNTLIVDVAQSVSLANRQLRFIPIRFGVIQGDFSCANNELKSLDFGPQKVGGNYDCSTNELTHLRGLAVSINGTFNCSYNPLESLDGFPEDVSTMREVSLRHISQFIYYHYETDPKKIAQDLLEARILAEKQHFETELKQLLEAASSVNKTSTVNKKIDKI